MLHWLQIVSKLLTILKRTCIKQIFSELEIKNKIVNSLLTISNYWFLTLVPHVVQARAEGPEAPSPGHHPGYKRNPPCAL